MSLDPKAIAEYRSGMEELVATHIEQLWLVPSADYGHYMQRVGYIRGIKEHLAALDRAEQSQYRRNEPEVIVQTPKRYED